MWFRIVNCGKFIAAHFFDEIGGFDKSADDFISALESELRLSRLKKVRLVLNSCGGDGATAFKIFDYLKERGLAVDCEVFRGYSAANILSMAASRIQMHDGGYIAVHAPSRAVYGTPVQIESALVELREFEQRIERLLCDRTEKPLVVVQRWLSKDTFFTAKEAWAAGLIDEIIPAAPAITTPASVETGAPDDGKSALLLDILLALGPIKTSNRQLLLRTLNAWSAQNVKQSSPRLAAVN